MKTVIVGAGIFGVTAARELRRRGHEVVLVDTGPIPHPLAASTDVSKVVRLEYGPDEDYTVLGEESLEGWRRWNRELGEELFHETGVLFVRAGAASPGTFEGDSWSVLTRRGHALERIDRAALGRYPAWNASLYEDGIFDRAGGWVESGLVVARLVERAGREGVLVREATFERLLQSGSRVTGIATTDHGRIEGDTVLLACGSWTPHVLPELAPIFRSTGQPVFHLRPDDPGIFAAERFPVFGADISTTGWYGFPLHPKEGVVKVARHGIGRVMHPESPARKVTAEETADLRGFLAGTFPALAGAPVVFTRVCLYCDTWDGHFWIARDPGREGLVLATGGSGHAYKFAPRLGALSADAVEGRENDYSRKFRWRPEIHPEQNEEAARCQDR